jgi:acyl carrier protein
MSEVTSPEAVEALLPEIAQLIDPAGIEADAPLFGDGLGIDSIDVLEIALVVAKRYGCQLKSDNEDNIRIFSSLRSLAAYIASQRSQ